MGLTDGFFRVCVFFFSFFFFFSFVKKKKQLFGGVGQIKIK